MVSARRAPGPCFARPITALSWLTRSSGVSRQYPTLALSGNVERHRLRHFPQLREPVMANHLGQVMATDFFVVPMVTYRMLLVLVILAHERRRVVHVAVSDHPI